jgi:3',5'-cyclic AMP phosphodiesterase CpdA
VQTPFLVVQLSDPHLGADWGGGDSVAMLAAAVESVRALDPAPDVVLLSGDIADHAADGEYEQVRELLGGIEAPLYAVAGNHDDRRTLRRHFDVPGSDSEPVQYAVELGPLRLVVLDSIKPGEDDGELGADRLAWLEATLAAAPDVPTLVALHHPPFTIGFPAFDELGLPLADRRALARVVEANPQVQRIVAGHVHRAIAGALAGRPVLTAPSTYVQAEPCFAVDELRWSLDPAGFLVHALVDGALVSHVQTVAGSFGSP